MNKIEYEKPELITFECYQNYQVKGLTGDIPDPGEPDDPFA